MQKVVDIKQTQNGQQQEKATHKKTEAKDIYKKKRKYQQ